MSPHVIDLRSAEDTRDVIHRGVQALAEGKVVAFPTETVYLLAASALSEDAVARLGEIRGSFPAPDDGNPFGNRFALAVKSADDALDYVPDFCAMGRRLGRRCWPGPVTLVCEDHHPDSLLRQLSPVVQHAITHEGEVGLRVPAHPAFQDVLRLLAGPVAVVNAPNKTAGDAVTAQDVLDALGSRVNLVLDDGRSRFGQPSSVVRVTDDQFEVLGAGVVSPQTLRRLASLIVLFVCTGNTCRSPMAEGMMRKLVAERLGCRPDQIDDHGVIVMSAGVAAMMGSRASSEAVQVMRDAEIDLSGHESQPLTEPLVRHADLILTMTRSHRQAVLNQFPSAGDRTQLVCRTGHDVADPVGGTVDQYRRCAEQIRTHLAAWLDELSLPKFTG